jgi:RNA polymerase subunit RPABC4/transcription elongation factor Spt4
MASCTSCGNDVTGKKFCPECGTPVQPASGAENQSASTNTCPRCNGIVKSGAAFCMHCGSSLTAQTAVATATPIPSVPSQPLTRSCIACHTEVPMEMAFCTNCGQSMQVSTQSAAPSTPAYAVCQSCGRQNNPGVNFCAGCGNPLGTSTPQIGYNQPSQPYSQYPQQPQYNSQYPQQYGQPSYQQPSMMGQQPMVLRCPICMAMSPVGTSNCPSCHTSLAGIVPTPANVPMQGQQGGFGGLFQGQGQGGNMAMGALGGAAAVIGGEILLHEIEGGFHRNRGYGRDEGDGLLGGLGDLANDVGLF